MNRKFYKNLAFVFDILMGLFIVGLQIQHLQVSFLPVTASWDLQ